MFRVSTGEDGRSRSCRLSYVIATTLEAKLPVADELLRVHRRDEIPLGPSWCIGRWIAFKIGTLRGSRGWLESRRVEPGVDTYGCPTALNDHTFKCFERRSLWLAPARRHRPSRRGRAKTPEGIEARGASPYRQDRPARRLPTESITGSPGGARPRRLGRGLAARLVAKDDASVYRGGRTFSGSASIRPASGCASDSLRPVWSSGWTVSPGTRGRFGFVGLPRPRRLGRRSRGSTVRKWIRDDVLFGAHRPWWQREWAFSGLLKLIRTTKLPDPSLDLAAHSISDYRVVIPTHCQAGPRYIAMKCARSDSKVFRRSPSRVVFTRWSEPDRHAS